MVRREEKTAGMGWWESRTAPFIGSSTAGVKSVISCILGRAQFVFAKSSGTLQFQVVKISYIDAITCAQCTSINAVNLSRYSEHTPAMLPWARHTHRGRLAWVCRTAPHAVSHSPYRVVFHSCYKKPPFFIDDFQRAPHSACIIHQPVLC